MYLNQIHFPVETMTDNTNLTTGPDPSSCSNHLKAAKPNNNNNNNNKNSVNSHKHSRPA